MLRQAKLAILFAAAMTGAPVTSALAQGVGKHLAPPNQVVAVRAARMFDARTGAMVNNPVVLVRGDRITDVGPNLAIPAGARVIDLGLATMMPGMIDTHIHANMNVGGVSEANRTLVALANVQIDLAAGFTTVLDMDTRGGYNTVDIRDQINNGRIEGPRMQVVGQSINQRATNYYPDIRTGRFQDSFIEGKNLNGPWEARAAVREAKLRGVDWIKIYTTQDFAGVMHMWKPDATLVNSPSLTFEEVQAIVDESHRMGLKVACHTYGGEGMASCINAGVDANNHLLELSAADARTLKQKNLPMVVTLDDLFALEKEDLEATHGRNSRLKLAEQAFKNARAAGVTIVLGSGATSVAIPHGRQWDQFTKLVQWGMTPAESLQTVYLPAAQMLNYGWDKDVGTIEKGKFADIIAVPGNPLADVNEMEHVRFVMKGGMVIRNDPMTRPAAVARAP